MIKSGLTFSGIDKEAYIKSLALVAMADGILTEEEKSLYESRMGDILVHPNLRDKYRRFLSGHFTTADVIIGNVNKRTLLYALRDSIMMAKIDGVVHEAELKRVNIIAEKAGIGEAKIEEMEKWVDEGIKWMTEGNNLVRLPLDD
jgi:uncharacterized tellurite resistance protein B-like protein